MTPYSTIENPEEAIDALFGAFRAEAFPEGWESGVLDTAPSAPVIRLGAAGAAATIPASPRVVAHPTQAATIPASPRVVAHPTAWERHRLTVARAAAVVAFLIGLGGLLSVLPIDEVNTVGDQENAEANVATGAPTTVPPPLAAVGEEVPSTIPGPTVTTIATTDQATAPTSAPLTVPPTTVPPTTVPPTTVPPTTVPPTTPAPPTTPTVVTVPTTVPITTETSPTVVTITPPEPVDVRIRQLAVSKITATSAVVSFTTNDCALSRYSLASGQGLQAAGIPSIEECRLLHVFRLGAEPLSNRLEPGTSYQVRITTWGQDGSTNSASISFTTLKA
jgi:hypothetical protein